MINTKKNNLRKKNKSKTLPEINYEIKIKKVFFSF